MNQSSTEQTKSFWRSLDELANSPEFQARAQEEFPGFANMYEGLGEAEVEPGMLTRRRFMQLSAAGLALAGLVSTGCRRPDLKILPYSRRPEGSDEFFPVHGLPAFYASCLPRPGGALPIIVESHDGRPTKIEGHPEHPAGKGRVDTHGLAAILDLYTPDRIRWYDYADTEKGRPKAKELNRTDGQMAVLWNGRQVSPAMFDKFVEQTIHARQAELRANPGRLRVLCEEIASPALDILKTKLIADFGAIWHTYEPLADSTQANTLASLYGKPLEPVYDFATASRIVAIGSDFLNSDGPSVTNAQAYASKRRLSESGAIGMNRLYVVESNYSITGTAADHRLRLPASHHTHYLAALAREIAVRVGKSDQVNRRRLDVAGAVAKVIPDGLTPPNVPGYWVKEVALDLLENANDSVVLVGPGQGATAYTLAALINEMLGSVGRIVSYREPLTPPGEGIASLTEAVNKNSVDTLIVLGGNPVLNAPADLKFGEALKKVKNRVRLGMFYDETSNILGDGGAAGNSWHLPMAHPLESWGDALATDGTYSLVQPLIEPLFDGRSVWALMAQVADYRDAGKSSDAAKGTIFGLVQESFTAIAKKARKLRADADAEEIEQGFRKFRHLGFVEGTAAETVAVEKPNLDRLDAVLSTLGAASKVDSDSLEVIFRSDLKVLDGRGAYNGWLVELPDPLTKLSWDNAALLSPKTAKELAVKFGVRKTLANGDIVRIKVPGGPESGIEIPVFILPGHADFSITLTLGYAPAINGDKCRISNVPSGGGFNTYPLRTSAASWIVRGATIEATRQKYDLVTSQEFGTIPEGRDILHDYDAEAYQIAANNERFRKQEEAALAKKHAHKHNERSHSQGHGNDHGPGHDKQEHQHVDPKEAFQAGYKVAEKRWEEGRRMALDLARPQVFDSQYQWGMVIDLNTCIGCSACMIACQSENNIPVVGKEEVKRNREMYWITIHRYFTTKLTSPTEETKDESPVSENEPRIVSQPIACVHCEAAPCETVCPVNAAIHSPEGLNLQVYNRCIGTRYCANNCPYKVRRFNWFNFNERHLDKLRVPTFLGESHVSTGDSKDSLSPKGTRETIKMSKNPDVTVRIRGVMEKCTYCVQRLERGKLGAKLAATKAATDAGYTIPMNPKKAGYDIRWRRKNGHIGTLLLQGNENEHEKAVIVPDGVITPACQQACPSEAIVFGNVADPESKVYKLKQSFGDYLLLGELNTKPRTSYLPRLRNLNVRMKEASA